MAKMRVHELAKEFGLSSKEMLEKLAELKIPAKNHASTLEEAYIDMVRSKLKPLLQENADEIEAQKEQEAKKKAEEEAQAKIQAEKERLEAEERAKLRREEEKRRRKAAEEQERLAEEERRKKEEQEAKEAEKHRVKDTAPVHGKSYNSLIEQIREEQKRLAQEKQEAAQAKQAQKQAKESQNQNLKQKEKKQEPALPEQKAPAQEASEETRQNKAAQGAAQAQKRVQESASQPSQTERKKKKGRNAQNQAQNDQEMTKKARKPKRQRYEEEDEAYFKQEVQSFQRDKVLAEARAAVEEASREENLGRRKKRKEKREREAEERRHQEAIEKAVQSGLAPEDYDTVQVSENSTVQELADKLEVNANDIIKRLFLLGTPLTLAQSMSTDLIELVADDLGRKVQVLTPEEENSFNFYDDPKDLVPRAPVVTVMGHVDHGKTSLLDAIRNTGVAGGEAGGITQHIGASRVMINNRQITFVDTPGHEAFTAMRARGAKVTDIVILVVAADDGVMPQTVEAINHSKAADVPIVVAINKVDKPEANPDRVKQELTEHGVIPEEWGGDNMFVEVSAKKRMGIDDLLETVLLQADVLELKANPNTFASGYVLEAQLDKGRGPVATILVTRGTLKVGDTIVAGTSYGRVRAMIGNNNQTFDEIKPSDPAEVLGLNNVPQAGDEFRVFEDERDARNLAEERAFKQRIAEQEARQHMTLETLFDSMGNDNIKDLNLIVKADVQGSIEALADSLAKMDQSEVKINIIHSAVGGITETDITLASASDAVIIGFGVKPQPKAKQLAEKEHIQIRTYRVIYDAIEEINAARVGMLSPDLVEQDTGIAEVREVFRVPKVGAIAGSYVIEGEISKEDQVRIVRDGTVVYEGVISSLRRFKDDVHSVRYGYECGIGVQGYQDIKVGDLIEGYRIVEVARSE
ncbi:MAG: translation initiation factor IF-2 [Coriobacteriia bacterium]|nr:translation initiation factor IF-2 [Coriobacteriia bacterium]